MSYQRQPAEEEARRSVSLSLTNPVFAKLIKMGRELGKTPQRMAQELFEEAYTARCMGKAKPAASSPGSARQGEEAGQASSAVTAELADLRAQLARMEARYDEQFAGRERALDQVVKAQDLAIAIGKERDALQGKLDQAEADRAELSRKCWNAEAERDRLREQVAELRETAKGQLVVVNQASEMLRREERKPEPIEILPASAEENRLKVAGLQRMLAGMKAAGNSIREIARETGLSEKAVRQALGPLPAP